MLAYRSNDFLPDLHPLSIEDVLHRRGYFRSKADYFSKHLFLRVLCHSLGDPDLINNPAVHASAQDDADLTCITTLPRSASPTAMRPASVLHDLKAAEAGYETGDDRLSVTRSQSGLFRRKGRTDPGRKSTVQDLEEGSTQTLVPESRSVCASRAFHALCPI